jgi:predicted nucleic acid-binding protein
MVVAPDTSIWIDHLRAADSQLAALLIKNQVLLHPFVHGEIAMGSAPRNHRLFTTLSDLPKLQGIADRDVLDFVARHTLYGSGIGYIDAHLLAPAYSRPDCLLWTRDRRLLQVTHKLAIAYVEPTAIAN